jgi:hypothetical protein
MLLVMTHRGAAASDGVDVPRAHSDATRAKLNDQMRVVAPECLESYGGQKFDFSLRQQTVRTIRIDPFGSRAGAALSGHIDFSAGIKVANSVLGGYDRLLLTTLLLLLRLLRQRELIGEQGANGNTNER